MYLIPDEPLEVSVQRARMAFLVDKVVEKVADDAEIGGHESSNSPKQRGNTPGLQEGISRGLLMSPRNVDSESMERSALEAAIRRVQRERRRAEKIRVEVI